MCNCDDKNDKRDLGLSKYKVPKPTRVANDKILPERIRQILERRRKLRG